MTDLDRWSAEVLMGWELYNPNSEFNDGLDHSSWTMKEHKLWYMPTSNWHPSDPKTGQIWMCVEKMREKGWQAQIWRLKHEWAVCFYLTFRDWLELRERDYTKDPNPAQAILLAAKAAWGGVT